VWTSRPQQGPVPKVQAKRQNAVLGAVDGDVLPAVAVVLECGHVIPPDTFLDAYAHLIRPESKHTRTARDPETPNGPLHRPPPAGHGMGGRCPAALRPGRAVLDAGGVQEPTLERLLGNCLRRQPPAVREPTRY